MNEFTRPPAFPIAGILEASLYVESLEDARDFYGGVLGLEEILNEQGRHLFYRCGDTMLLLFNPDATRQQSVSAPIPVPPHGAVGQGHLCFTVSSEHLNSARDHLTEHQIAIESEIEWPNGARSLYFRDPAGNSLEFSEPKLWGFDD